MNDKKYVWTLDFETNVPLGNRKCFGEQIQSELGAFSSFEKAKEEMQKIIMTYLNTANDLFTEEGYIRKMKKYLHKLVEYFPVETHETTDKHITSLNYSGYDASVFSYLKAMKFIKHFKEYITGEKELPEEFSYTDYLMGCKLENGLFSCVGVDDGPINGIDPKISINTFDFNDPDKEYIFMINDRFEEQWDEPSNFILLHLIKVEVDDPMHLTEELKNL